MLLKYQSVGLDDKGLSIGVGWFIPPPLFAFSSSSCFGFLHFFLSGEDVF